MPRPQVINDPGSLPENSQTCPRFASVIALCAFALLFGTVAITSFRQKSPTVDEPVHLFAGYSYLKWGDFRANPEHPPLAKLWAALPLLPLNLQYARSFTLHWDLIPEAPPDAIHTVNAAGELLFVANDADRLFFYAKLQMVLLTIVFGIFVYRWAGELFGFIAAIAALFIFCFDPNILAHSQIVHTDMAFTALFFVGTYFYWHALRKLTWFNVIFTCVFFGLAAITKYAYLAMLVAWGALGLYHILSSQPQDCTIGRRRAFSQCREKAAALSGILFCCLVVAYLFIWCSYGFRFDAIPGGGRHLLMAELLPENADLRGLITFIAKHRLFPEAWIYGQLYVFKNLARHGYLLGTMSDHGFWLYFPVAFAIKTPLPTLFLLLAASGLWVQERGKRKAWLFLIIPAAVYFVLAVLSRINIGLRHILPVYPFIIVLVGGAAAELWQRKSRCVRGGLVVLAVWYLGSAIFTYPHFLAFFNELARGSANGHRFLLDSNLDWGQDLKGLKRWLDENGVTRVQFLYFGYPNVVAPIYYEIDADYLPGSWLGADASSANTSSRPEHLAMSAHLLFGDFFRGEQQADFVRPFRALRPLTTIGHSIYIFRLSDVIAELREIVNRRPSSARAHADLGSLLATQGRTSDAIESYRRAISLDSSTIKALYNLGIILARSGSPEEAIGFLSRASQIRPLDVDIRYDLALVLVVAGKLDDAARHFREVLKIDPRHAKAHYNLAVVLEQQGALEGAVGHFREAVKYDASYARAYYRLGLVSIKLGYLEEAMAYLRQAVYLEPQFVDAHQTLGRALTMQGKKEEAIKHYETALQILKFRGGAPPSPDRK